MKIQAGRFYRARNGIIYGPMILVPGKLRLPFRVESVALDWREDGFFQSDRLESEHDLISEVYVSDTPPVVKETEAQLREMMRDPRYWRAREPEFVKRVTDGFRALVGGDTPPADAPETVRFNPSAELKLARYNGPLVEVQNTPPSLPDRATVPFKIMVPETKTLRDEFAMAMMDADDFMVGFKEHAEQLYRAADAMMEARKK